MLKQIETGEDYEHALARVYELMQTEVQAGSKDDVELEALSLAIKRYELLHFPIAEFKGAVKLPKDFDYKNELGKVLSKKYK